MSRESPALGSSTPPRSRHSFDPQSDDRDVSSLHPHKSQRSTGDDRNLGYRSISAPVGLSRSKTQTRPARKLVIRMRDEAMPSLPANFEENTWAELKSFIIDIFSKRQISSNLQTLYESIGDLCSHKLEGNLYQRIETECEAHISAAFQSLAMQSTDAEAFLHLVQQRWQDHCDQISFIRSVALHLDVKQAKLNPNVCSLWDMGLRLFSKHLSLFPEVERNTVNGLLQMIKRERSGEAIDQTLLVHLLKMFMALGIYSECFEKEFLAHTSKFYEAEGVAYMQQLGVPDYLKHVEVRLHEEHERCLLYLDAMTLKPLIATVEEQLLEKHISAILDKGFKMLLDQNCIKDLQRMYQLFSRVSALDSLRHALRSYIERSEPIIIPQEKNKDTVPHLLQLKTSLDTVWEESFSRNEAFSNTIKKSFECLIDLPQFKLVINTDDLKNKVMENYGQRVHKA